MADRDFTPTDRAELEDMRHYREWWKRPDPFDPRNAPDPDEPEETE